MEEELMFMIKNDLAEMKHNGFEIENIKMYKDLEMNTVVSYKYNGETFVITNDIISEEV